MSKMKWAAAPVALAAVLGAVSFGGPAGAGEAGTSNSTVSCEPSTLGPGDPALDCTILTFGEIQAVRVTDLTTHNNNFVRSVAPFGNDLAFKVTPGDKYKLTVTSQYGIKDTYKVLTDGTVTVIRAG